MKKKTIIGYPENINLGAVAVDRVRQKQERAVDLCELSIMKYLEGAGQDHHKAGIRAAINRMREELWEKRWTR